MSVTDCWQQTLAATAAAAGPRWTAPPQAPLSAAWRVETGHLAALALGGADARAFLEAQLTCRVPTADADRAQPGAWCNPQGRVVSTLVVAPAGEAGYLLLLPAALVEPVAAALARFVLRARVAIDPLPALLPRFGVCGEDADAALAGAIRQQTPSGPWTVARGQAGVVVAVPGPQPRRLALVDADTAAACWQALEADTHAHDQRLWRQLDIRAGWPWLDQATSERFVPQALALDRSGAVSFDKGCYPGQEIVARIHYRGRPSQRLAGIAGPLPMPASGSRLLAPGDTQASGRVLDAVPAAGERYEGLAVVAAGCTAGTSLHTAEGPAAGAEVQPWPRFD